MSSKPAYHEELLHWVWETARMDMNRLQSTSGESITIFHPGTRNHADGPDFLNAHIQIGQLKWHGDVELHWRPEDWRYHSHDQNPAYNKVILHVVWEGKENHPEVFRQDGSAIPTLTLKNCVNRPLRSFLYHYQKPDCLPCSGHFSYISETAFLSQLEKAERQYFEQKVNDLLAFWDPSLPPSKAWLKLLAAGLFDGLGISDNREAMRTLLLHLYPHIEQAACKSALIKTARSLMQSPPGEINWSYKGSRPSNRPEVRVPQAACCLWFLHQLPFREFLSGKTQAIWDAMTSRINVKPGLGTQRKKVLYGTVWLPAFYILGSTFENRKLKKPIFELWRKHRVELPKAFTQPFDGLKLNSARHRHSLGTVHQFRAYCQPKRCSRCKVFKSAISS